MREQGRYLLVSLFRVLSTNSIESIEILDVVTHDGPIDGSSIDGSLIGGSLIDRLAVAVPPLPLFLPLLMSPLPAQSPGRAGVQAGACMDRGARHWRACVRVCVCACVRAPSARLIVSCFGWAQSSVQ